MERGEKQYMCEHCKDLKLTTHVPVFWLRTWPSSYRSRSPPPLQPGLHRPDRRRRQRQAHLGGQKRHGDSHRLPTILRRDRPGNSRYISPRPSGLFEVKVIFCMSQVSTSNSPADPSLWSPASRTASSVGSGPGTTLCRPAPGRWPRPSPAGTHSSTSRRS